MNYLNDPHYDVDEAQLDHFDQSAAKRQRYQLWKERLDQVELQIEKDEAAPDPDADLSPKKKRLKRQIKEEALLRLEEAARTEDDLAAVQYHWDRRDSNRERKERLRTMLAGSTCLMLISFLLFGSEHKGRLNGIIPEAICGDIM